MISQRPPFREGEHFRVSPGAKWCYATLQPTRLIIDRPSTDTISFRDRYGVEWMRLTPTTDGKTAMDVREGYSWNGATWAPDFCLQLETLFHDIACQFLDTEHFPYSKREVDAGFLDLMKLIKFKLRYIFWHAVRKFGWAFRKENGEYSEVLTTHVLP